MELGAYHPKFGKNRKSKFLSGDISIPVYSAYPPPIHQCLHTLSQHKILREQPCISSTCVGRRKPIPTLDFSLSYFPKMHILKSAEENVKNL